MDWLLASKEQNRPLEKAKETFGVSSGDKAPSELVTDIFSILGGIKLISHCGVSKEKSPGTLLCVSRKENPVEINIVSQRKNK